MYGSLKLILFTRYLILYGRGHSVTTLRFEDFHGTRFKPLGPNHTEIVLHLNNSDGSIPFVSHGEQGVFKMPMEHLWANGLSQFRIFWDIGLKPWQIVDAYCDQLLANPTIWELFREGHYDVAIVDLVYNECGLALTHHFKVPSVGYWAFSFSSGEADFTTAALPPSHVPTFMSGLSDEMTFFERVYNAYVKMCSGLLMFHHCLRCDWVIQKYLPNTPRSWDLLGNLNGALINTNALMDHPKLLPPTFLQVGGMHIKNESAFVKVSNYVHDLSHIN